jgi:prepilin-type processing-associated H-X9-DG protein
MLGDAGNFSATGVNVNNPNYRQLFKITQIPRPVDIFTFLDEHPDSIDDGYFLNKVATVGYASYGDSGSGNNEWTDLPASYHNGSAAFAFADGHSALHHWIDADTIRPAQPFAAALPQTINSNSRADFDWVIQHMSIEN